VRLAWFSPWPPQHGGVAGRSAALVPALTARGHAIDVVVDEAAVATVSQSDGPPIAQQQRLVGAHEFVWRWAQRQYDLPVYHLSSRPAHRFIWPYLFRYPGLVVLHDARLHQARAASLLAQVRAADYQREFAWSHPEAAAASGLGLLGLEGSWYSLWPMLKSAVASARLVATHSQFVADLLAHDYAERPTDYIALSEGPERPDVSECRRQFRTAHGIPEDALVFGVHGRLTRERHVRAIVHAFAAVRSGLADARLLLVGAMDPGLTVDGLAGSLGLQECVHYVPVPDDAEFDRSIAASDVTVNLVWPSAWGTSGPWLRSLAMARPTVIFDLPEQTHVPALDPRTWRRLGPTDDLAEDADDRAVTVAIDLCDLDHSLRAALRRLGVDAALRERIGQAARRYWEREHTFVRMLEDYARVIERATTCPAPHPDWPAHLRPDPASHLHRVLERAGIDAGVLGPRLAGL
jgi:glycosyltransferase involved in cell wall biosynthesis